MVPGKYTRGHQGRSAPSCTFDMPRDLQVRGGSPIAAPDHFVLHGPETQCQSSARGFSVRWSPRPLTAPQTRIRGLRLRRTRQHPVTCRVRGNCVVPPHRGPGRVQSAASKTGRHATEVRVAERYHQRPGDQPSGHRSAMQTWRRIPGKLARLEQRAYVEA